MTTPQAYLIFGGAGGIGSHSAKLLAEAGHHVMVAGRTEAKLQAVSSTSEHIEHFVADATKSSEVEACVQATRQKFGRLDGVVNCVGSFGLKPLHLATDEDFERDWAQNVKTALNVTRAAVRQMTADKSPGSVVLMSSVAARFGMPNHESIATAKGGVMALMLSAAATYAADNIRVNAVAPGLIQTELTKSITQTPAMAQASASMHPLRRLGEPQHIARMVAFLLDPANDFITGQVFGVDGGLATIRPKR